jgi:hypothetical protein
MLGSARTLPSLIIAICTLLSGCAREPAPEETVRKAYA